VSNLVLTGSNRPPQPSTERATNDHRPRATPLPAAAAVPVRQSPPVKRSRFETLRLAADRSLLEQGDVEAAVRDYKRALTLASAEQRAIAPGQDTWLLMALKDAQIKENVHASFQHD
jgi:hypothetical protein